LGGIEHDIFTLVLLYGYPVVGGAEFISSAGIPLPMAAILLLAGSLTTAGMMSLLPLILIVTACGIAGDLLDFYLGRRAVGLASARIGGWNLVDSRAAMGAQRFLSRYSGMAIFLSRWLFTPIASVVSLLAGFSGYPFRKFLVADIAGDLFGATLYLTAGGAIGAAWPEISSFLSSIPGLVTATILGLALIGLGIQRLRQAR